MRRVLPVLAVCVLAPCLIAPLARADFGLSEFDVTFTGLPEGGPPGKVGSPEGETITQAGAHPFQMDTSFHFISTDTGKGGESIEEATKDLILTQMKGLAGNPFAVPRCSTADFLTAITAKDPTWFNVPNCSDSAAVGVVSVGLAVETSKGSFYGAVYNLVPPPGVAAKLGFWVSGVPVAVELGVAETPPYNILGGPTNISQVLEVTSSRFALWGVPADEAHDPLRGRCLDNVNGVSAGECPANISKVPFLTLPRACEGPLRTLYRADSWEHPGAFVEGFSETHDATGVATGMSGCGKLDFGPEIQVQPTTTAAESPSGLDLGIDVSDEGIANPKGVVGADIEATEFALPGGVTLNPSAAEGLGVCDAAQFEAASLAVQGCPDASKLGVLEVETPILENHTFTGAFYQAAPNDNPFGSLLAAYLMIRDPELGVFAKLPARIETDRATGQIRTIVEEMPPIPLEHVRVHLRSGARAPLVTPPSCDADPSTPGNDPYITEALLYPSSGAAPLRATSSFQITSGPGGGLCPPGGVPPFDPGFEAGAANSAAGTYAPFSMRLTRQDGQQDLTKFSAVLPPGVVGKLAGLGKCSDAAIAAARSRTGRAEQSSPSCPANSQIGRVLAGAGVGTALTYVPGSLYLAGPYHGAPLSVAAIVPAVAGPFDVGTVVTRVALKLDPTTAQVEVDGAASDPIPHILEGIPVKVRDIRVLADRPDFTLNPTDCDPFQTTAQIFGSGANPFNPADDVPLSREARFQASSCASLGFKPRLAFKLKGGTKRGDHPAFSATFTPRAGDANTEGLVVRLPRSAFLDQAHIRTICTRVQFAADACPAAAIYGKVKATTPLLEEALEGPVYLRSSNHNLPDLVFDLHGLVDIEVAARIDSKDGGIRSTLTNLPDAPISTFLLQMQGGRKGLIVNSRDLCGKKAKAAVELAGQNGKASSAKPVMRAVGCKQRKRR